MADVGKGQAATDNTKDAKDRSAEAGTHDVIGLMADKTADASKSSVSVVPGDLGSQKGTVVALVSPLAKEGESQAKPLSEQVLSGLRAADASGSKVALLPALKTDSGLSTAEMAKAMQEGITKFLAEDPKNIKDIKIVVENNPAFETAIKEELRKAAAESAINRMRDAANKAPVESVSLTADEIEPAGGGLKNRTQAKLNAIVKGLPEALSGGEAQTVAWLGKFTDEARAARTFGVSYDRKTIIDQLEKAGYKADEPRDENLLNRDATAMARNMASDLLKALKEGGILTTSKDDLDAVRRTGRLPTAEDQQLRQEQTYKAIDLVSQMWRNFQDYKILSEGGRIETFTTPDRYDVNSLETHKVWVNEAPGAVVKGTLAPNLWGDMNRAAEIALIAAEKVNGPVSFDYSGIDVIARPGQTIEDVKQFFEEQIKKDNLKREEYSKSPEGRAAEIESQRLEAEARVKTQAEVDSMVKALPSAIKGGNATTVEWLGKFAGVADRGPSGVEYDSKAIVDRLKAAGYTADYKGTAPGPDYDANSFARNFVASCLRGLERDGSIYPGAESIVSDYKVLAAGGQMDRHGNVFLPIETIAGERVEDLARRALDTARGFRTEIQTEDGPRIVGGATVEFKVHGNPVRVNGNETLKEVVDHAMSSYEVLKVEMPSSESLRRFVPKAIEEAQRQQKQIEFQYGNETVRVNSWDHPDDVIERTRKAQADRERGPALTERIADRWTSFRDRTSDAASVLRGRVVDLFKAEIPTMSPDFVAKAGKQYIDQAPPGESGFRKSIVGGLQWIAEHPEETPRWSSGKYKRPVNEAARQVESAMDAAWNGHSGLSFSMARAEMLKIRNGGADNFGLGVQQESFENSARLDPRAVENYAKLYIGSAKDPVDRGMRESVVAGLRYMSNHPDELPLWRQSATADKSVFAANDAAKKVEAEIDRAFDHSGATFGMAVRDMLAIKTQGLESATAALLGKVSVDKIDGREGGAAKLEEIAKGMPEALELAKGGSPDKLAKSLVDMAILTSSDLPPEERVSVTALQKQILAKVTEYFPQPAAEWKDAIANGTEAQFIMRKLGEYFPSLADKPEFRAQLPASAVGADTARAIEVLTKSLVDMNASDIESLRGLSEKPGTVPQERPYIIPASVSAEETERLASAAAKSANATIEIQRRAKYADSTEGATVIEQYAPDGTKKVSKIELPDGRVMTRTGSNKSGEWGQWTTNYSDGRPADRWMGRVEVDFQSKKDRAEGKARELKGEISFVYQFAKAPQATEIEVTDAKGRKLVLSDRNVLPSQIDDGARSTLQETALSPLKELGISVEDPSAIKLGDLYSRGDAVVAKFNVTLSQAQTDKLEAALKTNKDFALVAEENVKPTEKYLGDFKKENLVGEFSYKVPQRDQTSTGAYMWRENGKLMTMVAERGNPNDPDFGLEGLPGGFRGIKVLPDGSMLVEGPKESFLREAHEEHRFTGVKAEDIVLGQYSQVDPGKEYRGNVRDAFFTTMLRPEDMAALRSKLEAGDDAKKLRAVAVEDMVNYPERFAFDHATRLAAAIKANYPEEYKLIRQRFIQDQIKINPDFVPPRNIAEEAYGVSLKKGWEAGRPAMLTVKESEGMLAAAQRAAAMVADTGKDVELEINGRYVGALRAEQVRSEAERAKAVGEIVSNYEKRQPIRNQFEGASELGKVPSAKDISELYGLKFERSSERGMLTVSASDLLNDGLHAKQLEERASQLASDTGRPVTVTGMTGEPLTIIPNETAATMYVNEVKAQRTEAGLPASYILQKPLATDTVAVLRGGAELVGSAQHPLVLSQAVRIGMPGQESILIDKGTILPVGTVVRKETADGGAVKYHISNGDSRNPIVLADGRTIPNGTEAVVQGGDRVRPDQYIVITPKGSTQVTREGKTVTVTNYEANYVQPEDFSNRYGAIIQGRSLPKPVTAEFVPPPNPVRFLSKWEGIPPDSSNRSVMIVFKTGDTSQIAAEKVTGIYSVPVSNGSQEFLAALKENQRLSRSADMFSGDAPADAQRLAWRKSAEGLNIDQLQKAILPLRDSPDAKDHQAYRLLSQELGWVKDVMDGKRPDIAKEYADLGGPEAVLDSLREMVGMKAQNSAVTLDLLKAGGHSVLDPRTMSHAQMSEWLRRSGLEQSDPAEYQRISAQIAGVERDEARPVAERNSREIEAKRSAISGSLSRFGMVLVLVSAATPTLADTLKKKKED